MSAPTTTIFSIERLRSFDGPAYFLGGGFLAGLLVFLVWVSALPNTDRHAVHARGNDVAGAEQAATPGNGVLGGITGGGREATPAGAEGSSFFTGAQDEDDSNEDSTLAPDDSLQQSFVQSADSMPVDEDPAAQAQAQEGALTDSLLDAPPADAAAPPAPPAEGSAPGAPLLTYYVEVEVAPGQVQMLQLNAESPEHARAILRDFRGDPRILRGPSTEPLP